MKTTTKILLATILSFGMLALTPKASASTLNFGDAFELGTVAPDNPQGDQFRVDYVNFMIALTPGTSGTENFYDKHGKLIHSDFITRTNNFSLVSLPMAVLNSLGGLTNGMGTSINLTTLGTFYYLFAHYGGPGGGTSFVWDISSFNTGVITIPGSFGNYGLSGWSLIDTRTVPTPDGGATIMLLGLGLSALGMVRRFFLKS